MQLRIFSCALLLLLAGLSASGQTPAGFELTLFDLDGTSKVVGRLPASVYAPRVSPDGKRVAFETRDPAGPDGPRLWVADLSDLAGRRPFAPMPGPMNWAPMWTTDGERLVYLVSGELPDAVYWRRADGSDAEEQLTTSAHTVLPQSWAPDGQHIVVTHVQPDHPNYVALLATTAPHTIQRFQTGDAPSSIGSLSADGHWMT